MFYDSYALDWISKVVIIKRATIIVSCTALQTAQKAHFPYTFLLSVFSGDCYILEKISYFQQGSQIIVCDVMMGKLMLVLCVDKNIYFFFYSIAFIT